MFKLFSDFWEKLVRAFRHRGKRQKHTENVANDIKREIERIEAQRRLKLLKAQSDALNGRNGNGKR